MMTTRAIADVQDDLRMERSRLSRLDHEYVTGNAEGELFAVRKRIDELERELITLVQAQQAAELAARLELAPEMVTLIVMLRDFDGRLQEKQAIALASPSRDAAVAVVTAYRQRASFLHDLHAVTKDPAHRPPHKLDLDLGVPSAAQVYLPRGWNAPSNRAGFAKPWVELIESLRDRLARAEAGVEE
jgi:hypothetical protein